MSQVLVIAEAGVNHNGSLELAKKLVDAAADAGVDIVKFQTFRADKLVGASAPKAEYQTKNTGNSESQLEMLKKLELSDSDHRELIVHCKKRNIRFLSTPFDHESINFLVELGIDIFKIPSGEITNLPYLRKIASFNKETILSTGMATLEEVEETVAALYAAGLHKDNLTLLHCTTEYPCPLEDVNLFAMLSMGEDFDLPIGYSDHTQGLEIPTAAVALGATVIEKHFTLDKNLEGPDHKASLEPQELKEMVRMIRAVELSLGDGVKEPRPSELKNRAVARKSIVAAMDINKGEKLTEQNLMAQRPGTGISPMRWDAVIGSSAIKDFSKGDLIEL